MRRTIGSRIEGGAGALLLMLALTTVPASAAETEFTFGGYAKLDYVQDFDGAYDRFQFPVSEISVPGDGRPEQSGYANMFARESRINFDFRKIAPTGTPLQVFLEIDFWNLDDAPFFATPRLRHFYPKRGGIQMNDRVTITHLEDGIADVRMVRTDKMNALDPAQFQRK